MILPLRRRHRRMWLALGLVLPAILLAAASARRAPVWMEQLPEVLLELASSSDEPLAHFAGQQNSYEAEAP